MARWPASESRGRPGWDSDSIRVSRIRSAISPISRDEQQAVGRRRHRRVEVLVALDATAPGLDVLLHQGQGVLDALQVGLGAPRSREAGDLGLQRVAGLDDLGQAVGVGADRLDDARGRPGTWRDDRAVTVPDGHRADDLERHERLAERGPADAEARGELPLGGQLVARLEAVLGLIHAEICSATCS